MPGFYEKKLIDNFKGKGLFTRAELLKFYRSYEPDLKESTFGWRVYDLNRKSIIRTVRAGVYTLAEKARFNPDFSQDILKLASIINRSYKGVEYCIWETAWLNEFTQHQAVHSMSIVEIEKDLTGSLFNTLTDNLTNRVYINPGEEVIRNYVTASESPVIVKNLITRSPVRHVTREHHSTYIPELEKILVDVFVERRLFYLFQGSETGNIFRTALEWYHINYSTLFNYAARRSNKDQLKTYLKERFADLIEVPTHD